MAFRLGIFGVLIAALIGVMVFAYSILNPTKHGVEANAPAAAPVTEQVLTAAAALPGGSLLQPGNVSSAPILITTQAPGELVDNTANRAALIGSMIRVPLGAGSPILDNEVIRPGDHGFLAAVLAPGMRAVTVAVDTVTGANGLIWPGDNVDVLLTQNISGAPENKSIAAEVVLSNVRVIATGSELVKDASNGTNGNTNDNASAGTVTLEVTQDEASRCLVATNLGRLSLIVHSAQGVQNTGAQPEAPPPVPVFAGDVSPAMAEGVPAQSQVTTVNVISSGGDGEFKF
jgi:pilus assembly protein CpaB